MSRTEGISFLPAFFIETPWKYICRMTRILKWTGVLAAVALVAACFMPWVHIISKDITITGIDPASTNYGKPGYFHWAMAFFFLLFSLIPKLWAKRANLLVVALNIGWALRNFLIISSCEAGECPVRKLGIFLALVSSVIMLLAAVFPDVELPVEKKP